MSGPPLTTARRLLRDHGLLLAIVTLAISVRALAFGSIPSGLNQDEAATGYDAFALLHFGIDRNGFHNPAVMVAWGSGMSALPEYLAMLSFALFGFSVASLRAVNLVFAIFGLLAFYATVRRSERRRLALLCVFLLAICPWHVMMSRWGHEANLLPSLFMVATYFLARGTEHRWSFLLSAVLFALCLYAYAPAYAAVPVFAVSAVVYLRATRSISWAWVLQASALFCLVASPILLFLVINQLKLDSIRTSFLSIPRLSSPPRYQTMSSVFGGELFRRSAENLWALARLLFTQNDGQIYNALPGYGVVYPFGMPLAVVGLALTLRDFAKGKRDAVFVFLWLSAALVLAALEPVNINRINLIFFPIVFFVAVGVDQVAKRCSVLFAILSLHLVAFAAFSLTYFGALATAKALAFSPGFAEAIHAASATPGKICLSAEQPYMLVLFYEATDANTFVRTVVYEEPGAEFRSVRSFDRYVFGLKHCQGNPEVSAYVVGRGQEHQFVGWNIRFFESIAVATRP